MRAVDEISMSARQYAPELLQDFRADPSFNDERRFRAPASCLSSIVANGRVARELPVASALLIRQELAQRPPFDA